MKWKLMGGALVGAVTAFVGYMGISGRGRVSVTAPRNSITCSSSPPASDQEEAWFTRCEPPIHAFTVMPARHTANHEEALPKVGVY